LDSGIAYPQTANQVCDEAHDEKQSDEGCGKDGNKNESNEGEDKDSNKDESDEGDGDDARTTAKMALLLTILFESL